MLFQAAKITRLQRLIASSLSVYKGIVVDAASINHTRSRTEVTPLHLWTCADTADGFGYVDATPVV